jgi:hypothetical protein
MNAIIRFIHNHKRKLLFKISQIISLLKLGETQNARCWLLRLIFVVYFFVLLEKVSKMEEVESIPQEIFEKA